MSERRPTFDEVVAECRREEAEMLTREFPFAVSDEAVLHIGLTLGRHCSGPNREYLPVRCANAIAALTHGQNDGAHHKDWAIDQAMRALLGDGYARFRELVPDWEEGIPA